MRQALKPAKIVPAVLAVIGLGLFASGGFAAKSAAPGSLDPTFGKKGVASFKTGGRGRFVGLGVAAAKDGGVVQSALSNGESAGLVIKYTKRGHRDRSFGQNGLARLRFATGDLDPRDILVGSKGRILVTGEGSPKGGDWYGAALASLKPNGKPNRSFGRGGLALPKKLKGFTPLEMAFAPGDKIVVVGYFGGIPAGNTAVARFTAGGHLDRSFSRDGLVRYPVATNQLGRTVAVDRRGRIVVGSPGGAKYRHVHDIARLLPNGRFDRSFGSAGRRSINPTKKGYDEISDVTIDRQGRILVAGGSTSYAGTVTRLRPDGATDRSFGKRGVTEIAWFTPESLALDRKNRILVIGYSSSGNSDESGEVDRLSKWGKQDASFRGDVWGASHLFDGFVDRKGRVVSGGGNRNRKVETLTVARTLNR